MGSTEPNLTADYQAISRKNITVTKHHIPDDKEPPYSETTTNIIDTRVLIQNKPIVSPKLGPTDITYLISLDLTR